VGDPGEEVSDEEHRVAAAIEEEALLLLDDERTLHGCTHEQLHSFLQILLIWMSRLMKRIRQ